MPRENFGWWKMFIIFTTFHGSWYNWELYSLSHPTLTFNDHVRKESRLRSHLNLNHSIFETKWEPGQIQIRTIVEMSFVAKPLFLAWFLESFFIFVRVHNPGSWSLMKMPWAQKGWFSPHQQYLLGYLRWSISGKEKEESKVLIFVILKENPKDHEGTSVVLLIFHLMDSS